MPTQTVHLTWFSDVASVTPTPANLDSIRAHFGDVPIEIWTIDRVRALMTERHDIAVRDAFDRLIPYAFKSDLASYYLLNAFGGWYTDLNNFFVAPPPSTDGCSMIVFKDVHDENAPWSIATCLMYSVPNNVALQRAIDLVVDNCTRRDLGRTPLCVSGPTVLGSAIAGIGLVDSVTYISGEFVRRDGEKVLCTRDETVFARYKPNALPPGNAGVPGGNDYNALWAARAVFADEDR